MIVLLVFVWRSRSGSIPSAKLVDKFIKPDARVYAQLKRKPSRRNQPEDEKCINLGMSFKKNSIKNKIAIQRQRYYCK
jgi:hypothetical protein